jgi:2-oxoglutarate/2-oxoacid ferredoxin oxidoreductase subunit alpha
VRSAVEALQKQGQAITALCLRQLYPLPNILETLLPAFKKIVVVELNEGQLSKLIRDQFLLPVEHFGKVQGQPLKIQEVQQFLETVLPNKS